MENSNKISTYYGGISYLRKNLDKKLCIFIIDDNLLYANILKDRLQRSDNFIHVFATGEQALQYTDLQPDFAIIDYHLDGSVPWAKKGDQISKMIKLEVPNIQTMIITSDYKLCMLQDIEAECSNKFNEKMERTEVILTELAADLAKEKEVKYIQRKVWKPIGIAASIVALVIVLV